MVDIAVNNEATFTITDNDAAPPANVAPTANAGPNQPSVPSGSQVTLDGSGSTDDGTIPDDGYAWTRAGGSGSSPVTLTNSMSSMPTFTADTLAPGDSPVTHEFSLMVTDDDGAPSTNQSTVTITVIAPAPPPNVAPTANAGPNQPAVPSGSQVTLDGSGSTDSDGTIAADGYAWTRAGGSGSSPVTLTNSMSSMPTFTADTLAPGAASVTHEFSLVVTDDDGEPSTNQSTVTITVIAPAPPPNVAPTANAGPNQPSAPSGSQVTLDGRGSTDSDGTIPADRYAWTRAGGSGSSPVTLTNSMSSMPTFTADTLAPGAASVTHEFSLVVTDNDGAPSTNQSTVTITVIAPAPPSNVAPIANAGPNQPAVPSGSQVTLDGSGSTDSDGTIPVDRYAWTRAGGSGSSPVTLTNSMSSMPTFTADTLAPGAASVTHEFSLVVTDNDGAPSTNQSTVTITVIAPAPPANVAPTANAGPNQPSVPSGTQVTLDGSGSTNNDGTSPVDGYSWTRTGGTGSRSLTLSNPAVQQPTFTADTLAPGAASVTHVFSLVVTEGTTESLPATVTITVMPDPNPDLTVPIEEDEQSVAARTDTLKRGVGMLGSEIGSSLAGAVSGRGGQVLPQSKLRLSAAAGSGASGLQPGAAAGTDFDPIGEYGSVKDALYGVQASQLLDKSEDGARFAGVWLKGDVNRFKDYSEQGERDGDIKSLHGGLDVRLTPQLLVGLGGSWHDGDFDYTGQGGISGKAEFEIASLYPYVNWDHDGTSAWAALGLGSGELKVTEGDRDRTSDLDHKLAALGVAQHFEQSERIDTVLRLEAFYSNLEVDGSAAGQQALGYDGFDTEVWELRSQGEVGWTLVEREGLHLRPYIGLGLRVDEGNELGTVQEVGLDLDAGDLHLRAEGHYHRLEGRSRVYGYSLTADYDSDADSRGLQFALRSQQGRQSGFEEFDTNSSLQESQDATGRRTEAELGYGLLLGRSALLKPYLVRRFASERDSSEFGLDYRLRDLQMRLAFEQTRPDSDQSEDDRLTIKARLEF